MSTQDVLCITGLEVYKTEDTNVEKSSLTSDISASDSNNDDNQPQKEGYVLHNGELKEIFYTNQILDNDFDYDYEDISDSGSLKLANIDETRFYKGIRVSLKKAWKEHGKIITWDDLEECLLGFITEQTYSEKGVTLKVSGMTKLLEQEKQFSFTQTKISVILKEMIESAGLKAKIDTTGLKDDVIDYTNISSDSSSSNASIGDSTVSELAQKVCKGKTTDRDKAQAIHTYIRDHVQYPSPNYSDHKKCPKEVFKSGYSNCCDRARAGHEMANAVNLENRGVHGSNHVWVQYKINGSWVDSDPGVSRPKLGSVWEGQKMNSVWEFPSCS